MEITKIQPFINNKGNITLKDNLKFILPSLLGVLLFMIPVKNDGEITIPVAILSKIVINFLGVYATHIITIIIAISGILSLVTYILKPEFIIKNKLFNSLFNIKPLWLIARVLGSLFALLSELQIGPDFIISDITGRFVLNDLLTILFSIFLFAGLLLPLLLDFGLLEFFGSLLTKIMRPIFKLPGRSSIDCITSWLGDGTLGIILTSKQYEDGFYTKKEAAIVSTTFSAVSITFSLVVISQVGLSHMFIPFYLTATFAGVVAAIIVPRIPPLSNKSNEYFNGETEELDESTPEGYNPVTWGYLSAIEKANKNTSVKEFFTEGFKNVLDMWLGVLPVVMFLATTALIIAEYTTAFQILGLPFVPLLKLLQVPEAVAASQTLVVGFADMLLPSVLAANTITNEMTKFIIASVSVTQLIYMSEVGSVLLGSKIPVNLKELLIIFLERTLVTLPIIVLIANFLF